MPYCVHCGKKRPAFLLSSNNLCFSCANEARKQAHHQAQIEQMREQYKARPNRTYHIVGLDHYQDAIDRAFPKTEESKLRNKELIERYSVGTRIPIFDIKGTQPAQLVPEPENPYDHNAIAVYVNGEKIGHIDRDTAAKFDAPLELVTKTTAKMRESAFKLIRENAKGKIVVEKYNRYDITVTISFK